MTTQNEKTIFHIAFLRDWQTALENGKYSCQSLTTEGFIHFSQAEQVVATANRHYHGVSGLVLLRVNVKKLTARLKYETSTNGEIYPHLFGPLNLDAVEKVVDFSPNSDGVFTNLPDQIL